MKSVYSVFMKAPLISYFDRKIDLSPEEEAYLMEHVPTLNLDNHTILLREGEISSAFYFVISGFVRMYYVVDGQEKTTFIYSANDFVSSYESFTKQVPSKHYLQTLQPTQVAVFRADVVADIIARFPRLESLSRMIMEEELSIYQEMIASFVTLNAEQRYLQLLAEKPHLLQEIPQYHIATYLGVSPETLSRIKQRISAKL